MAILSAFAQIFKDDIPPEIVEKIKDFEAGAALGGAAGTVAGMMGLIAATNPAVLASAALGGLVCGAYKESVTKAKYLEYLRKNDPETYRSIMNDMSMEDLR